MLLADVGRTTGVMPPPRLLTKYSAAADLALRVFDLAVVVASALVAYRILYGSAVPTAAYRVAIGTTLLYATICFTAFPLYRNWRGRELGRELLVLSCVFSGVFALFTIHALVVQFGQGVSRTWIAVWFVVGLATLVIARTVLRNLLESLRLHGVDVQRVVVVGLRQSVMKIDRYLERNPWVGVQVVGYFRSPYDLPIARQRRAGLPCLGDADGLLAYLEHHRVDQVWISLPMSERDRLKDLLRGLERHPINVKLVPDLFDLGMLNQSGEQIGNVPVINLRQGGVDRSTYLIVAKSLLDRIMALVALLLLCPLMLAIAIGVKLSSPGPVLFRQRRHGRGGRQFWMLKFRSMRAHEERDGAIAQATRGDSRITPFGAFLRRSSLDELPQLFNVLSGSMSLVGPRPHAAQHNTYYERLIQHYMQRHYVKPGITGWAQVNGYRGETPELRTMKKRVQYDLDYIRRWSLWLDFKIIVLTAFRVIGQKNAY